MSEKLAALSGGRIATGGEQDDTDNTETVCKPFEHTRGCKQPKK